MKLATRSIALVACLWAADASAASPMDLTYRFDDGHAAALAGQTSASVTASGLPLTVAAGTGDFLLGGNGAKLTAIAPGSIPGLPQIAGIGIASSGTFGSAVDPGETIQFTIDPGLALTSIRIRTFGTATALLVYTYPVPGSVMSNIQNSTENLGSYYPGTSEVATLVFAPGVTRVGIAPFTGNQRPGLLVLSVSGNVVPEPPAFAGAIVALIGVVGGRRRNS